MNNDRSADVDTSAVPDYLRLLDLTSRCYVVVGAGQGMGRQVCHALAQAGAARILCVDISAERAAAVSAEVGIGIPLECDVTARDGVAALVACARERLGRIDGLIDIVGMARWGGISDLPDDIIASQFAVSLDHAVRISRDLASSIADTRGCMVFISSVSGMYGAPHHAAYGMAKAALISWVKSLAVELGPLGVRANSIAPGTILTPRMDVMWDGSHKRAVGDNAPLHRLGATQDIGAAVLFLVSDMAAYISGQTLVVDGGVSAKFPFLIGVPE